MAVVESRSGVYACSLSVTCPVLTGSRGPPWHGPPPHAGQFYQTLHVVSSEEEIKDGDTYRDVIITQPLPYV